MKTFYPALVLIAVNLHRLDKYLLYMVNNQDIVIVLLVPSTSISTEITEDTIKND